jgi:spore germination cell wall hydrolase CwlJ-like protein
VTDEELFALCLWREASGEGYTGMLAVAWVILNRTIRWKKTLHDVIMGPNQFTSMSVEKNPRNPGPDDPQMAEARTIVAQVTTGTVQDITNGASYYANLAIATSGWFFEHIVEDKANHPLSAQIGRHTFYL